MNPKRIQILLKIGVAIILLGSLDPMEGSILINLGSVLVSVCGYLLNKRWKWWSISASMLISIGVISLWSVSALGGFDPKTEWWWLLAILPYPVGWLGVLFTFIYMAIKQFRLEPSNKNSH